MSERRYVQIWLVLTIGLLGLVLALNLAVDPYRLRLAGSIGDAGILRPDVYSFVRVNKAFGIARADPDVVLLGSSRVQWGFERDALPFTGRRPFNLALSGPRFDEVWATFQCMLAHGTPRTTCSHGAGPIARAPFCATCPRCSRRRAPGCPEAGEGAQPPANSPAQRARASLARCGSDSSLQPKNCRG